MRQQEWQRTVKGYLLLPHLVPVLFVEFATFGFAVLAWDGLPPPFTMARLLLAMLGGQLAIGAINEIVDLPDDMVGKPAKPLVSGAVSVRGAWAVVIVGLAMMTGFGLSFGVASFGLLALGTGLGIAYDLWLKRTSWSWAPYFLALPLLPIWVFVSVGRWEPRLLLLYPLGALATIGIHFAQALPDVEIDRETGLSTPTSRMGVKRTFALAWLAALSAPLLAWFSATLIGVESASNSFWVATTLTLMLAIANVALVAIHPRSGLTACFPLIALCTLASALSWTIAVAT